MSAEWKSHLTSLAQEWEKKTMKVPSAVNSMVSGSQEGSCVVKASTETKKAIVNGRDLYVSRRLKLRTRKRRNCKQSESYKEKKFSLIPPSIGVNHTNYSPYICRKCQLSSNGIRDSSTGGQMNLLRLPTMLQRKYTLGLFPHVSFCFERKVQIFSKLNSDVVVRQSVEQVNCQIRNQTRKIGVKQADGITQASSCNKAMTTTAELEKKSLSMYKQMASRPSSYFLRIACWYLFKFFGNCFSSICYQSQDIEALKEASKRRLPLIYLPLHKSHLDYVIVIWLLYCSDIKIPHAAAGENLAKASIIGLILRTLGAFFIRRNNAGRDKLESLMYNAVLQEYVTQLLKHRESLEIFIEGTRSRCGKPLQPKTGLLSCVTQAVVSGSIPDALIVPVAISYDIIPEATGYAREAMGSPKQPESLWQFLCAFYRMIRTDWGQIKVNFGKPYSIHEFINRQRTFSKVVCLQSPRLSDSSTSLQSYLCMSDTAVETTRALAYHVINDAENSSCHMCTNLVAFLLLTKYREGVYFRDLVNSVDWLIEEIKSLNRHIGFSGESVTVVTYAIQLLRKAELIEISHKINDINGETQINLPCSVEKHLALAQYGNEVIPTFIQRAVLGTTIVSCMGGLQALNPSNCDQKIAISGLEMQTSFKWLAMLLQREFIIWSPCSDIDTCFQETIESMMFHELLTCAKQSSMVTERQRNVAHSFSLIDEDDEEWDCAPEKDTEYEVPLSDENIEMLRFYTCILGPFLESYWLTGVHLKTLLPDKEVEMEVFRSEVHQMALKKVENGVASYAEVSSVYPIRNAVQSFEDNDIIITLNEDVAEGRPRKMQLSNFFRTEDAIDLFLNYIDKFR